MKFGHTLTNSIQPEWRFYAVDYKPLKKTLKGKHVKVPSSPDSAPSPTTPPVPPSTSKANVDLFNRILEDSVEKLGKFYESKEASLLAYVKVLEERVSKLQKSEITSPLSRRNSLNKSLTNLAAQDGPGDTSSGSESDDDANIGLSLNESEVDLTNISSGPVSSSSSSAISSPPYSEQGEPVVGSLKDLCRETAQNDHFKDYIYSIKSLRTFERELSLLVEFIELNRVGFSKILKKFDKVVGSSIREKRLEEVTAKLPFLASSGFLKPLLLKVQSLINTTLILKPILPSGWSDRKVYTIGCFDLFHRGHVNVLASLREFGHFIVAGIHDDESYFKLKKKYPIDNLEKRMANVKPHVDMIYVIPSTDPMPYIQMMVSPQDIEAGLCCYARGDDMLQFPGRDWVESVMPVHFLPRTEGCSSSLIRTIYHSDSDLTRHKAAFAKTRYDGKPVDENGEVIKTS
mmetsp:Transcript_27504/g.54978  ORF Transcript_27504/g.54978 Transcript_27504/m.54978 type:complete len:459 (+) Transcript_27504:77-1453(+)